MLTFNRNTSMILPPIISSSFRCCVPVSRDYNEPDEPILKGMCEVGVSTLLTFNRNTGMTYEAIIRSSLRRCFPVSRECNEPNELTLEGMCEVGVSSTLLTFNRNNRIL